MAFQPLALSRIGKTMRDDNRSTSIYVYSTADAAATVLAAGYFDAVRHMLKPGDAILTAAAIGGSGENLVLRVGDVPETGSVTVVLAFGPESGSSFRGFGNACYQTIAAYGLSNTQRSQRMRMLHKLPHRFSEISLMYQVFDPKSGSGVIVDTKFAAPMNLQAAFEATPVLGVTGLAPRTPFQWGGQGFRRYDPANWDPDLWFAETEILNVGDLLGRYIEAGELFGLHSGQTLDALDTGLVMPKQRGLSNWLQRYTGYNPSAEDLVATGALFSASSYAAAPATRISNPGGMGPVMILAKVPKTFVSMAGLGDSISQDQKVGYGVAPALYDVNGDQDGNASWWTMGAARLGVGAVNLSRGSDGDKNLIDPAKWAGRRAILAKAKPTVVDELMGMNDTAAATQNPTNWAAGAAVALYQVLPVVGARFYMVTKAGTTGASAPTGTTIGAKGTDGTAELIYLGPRHADSRDKAYTTFAWKCAVIAQIKAAVPTAYVRAMLPLLKATSTDNFATDGGVPATDYGALQSRGKMRELMQLPELRQYLGADELFDVSGGIETAPGSGVMKTNGTAGYVMDPDGTHPLDEGQRGMSLALPAPPAVSALQINAL